MDDNSRNAAIARVILSTKRKSREYSVFSIAQDIEDLVIAEKGISNVAKIIGISSGMLNQFLSVKKLPAKVVEMVKSRMIDSVSTIYYLSKFDTNDAIALGKIVANNSITSHELRTLLPYRKQFPHDGIDSLVDKIKESKNIKVSVIRIPNASVSNEGFGLNKKLIDLVGSDNLLAIVQNDGNLDIKVTKAGEKILKEKSKLQGKSFMNFVNQLVN